MKAKTMSGSDPAKKTVMILANSSGGLYDFRNELVQKLLQEYRVVASLPDTVRDESGAGSFSGARL